MGGLMMAAAAAAMQAASAAAPAVPPVPAATVAGNTVTHAGEKVRVTVPAGAAYAGAERFNLYGVADAEIHVFVEADAAKKMRRLYWVQFESYLPSNDHRYNYADGNKRLAVAGDTVWVRAGPVPTNAPMRAGGDRESVMRILARGGYTLPAEAMNVRMVRILDDPAGTGHGRRELMVIYAEDLAAAGKSLADFAKDGKLDPAAWQPFEQPLVDRATAAVKVERF